MATTHGLDGSLVLADCPAHGDTEHIWDAHDIGGGYTLTCATPGCTHREDVPGDDPALEDDADLVNGQLRDEREVA
jgi:hypothetical protein